MYKGFNLKVDSNLFEQNFFQNAKDIHESIIAQNLENSKIVRKRVDELLSEDESISANEIIEDWFISQKYDIFLSHSHIDKDLAIYLAVWLKYYFNLDTFIDSIVWGNFTELAQQLNRKYSKNPNQSTYDYDKAQNVFTHVNALLNTSLTNMINNCECVFFLNTDNSITESGYKAEKITLSPWIYHELLITKVIEKINPRPSTGLENRSKNEAHLALDSINESLKIKYIAEVEHLFDLDTDGLINWKNIYQSDNDFQQYALDILYAAKKRYEIYG